MSEKPNNIIGGTGFFMTDDKIIEIPGAIRIEMEEAPLTDREKLMQSIFTEPAEITFTAKLAFWQHVRIFGIRSAIRYIFRKILRKDEK